MFIGLSVYASNILFLVRGLKLTYEIRTRQHWSARCATVISLIRAFSILVLSRRFHSLFSLSLVMIKIFIRPSFYHGPSWIVRILNHDFLNLAISHTLYGHSKLILRGGEAPVYFICLIFVFLSTVLNSLRCYFSYIHSSHTQIWLNSIWRVRWPSTWIGIWSPLCWSSCGRKR